MHSLTIIDAHLHLWDPTRFRMPWLDPTPLLNTPYDLADFAAHTAGLPIEAMVYLQVEVAPAYALLEARWVAERAAQDPRLKGLVAWAPLEDGDCCRSFLEALLEYRPLLKGIRRLIQGESLEFALQPGFVRGVQLLADYDLSCDLCIYHPQLVSTIALVRQCPATRFVLDHIAKPDIKDGRLDPWRDQIRTLAALPNVSCKLSGMVTEADHAHWTADDLRPYVAHVIECFGEDRVLFGGDWPVALLASPYRRWVETLDSLTADLPEPARRKLWAENARAFYRL